MTCRMSGVSVAIPSRTAARDGARFTTSVLPDVTRDEQREAADELPPAAGDEWLRANRPPHHGG